MFTGKWDRPSALPAPAASGAAGGVEDERVVAVVIDGEKTDALDVVPVEVGKEKYAR